MPRNYLEHHGIHGQKWGERNGPPYPLNQKAHKKVVKRGIKSTAKRLKSGQRVGKKKREKVSGWKEHYDTGYDKDYNYLDPYSNKHNMVWKDSGGNKHSKSSALTDGNDFDWNEVDVDRWGTIQKPTDHIDDYKDMATSGEQYEAHKAGRLTDIDLYNCNPGWGKPGTTRNCAKNVATLEAHLRGYDMRAGRTDGSQYSDAMEAWFKGAKISNIKTDPDTMESIMKNAFGKHTSGYIGIQYPGNSGGHAMHWTIDDNDDFEIQDGQPHDCITASGRHCKVVRYSSIKEMADDLGIDANEGFNFARLDNCEMNLDAMGSDSVFRGNAVQNRFTERVGNYS